MSEKNLSIKKSLRDIVVIGGGPAGLAAAIAASEEGCEDVLLIERDHLLGGILNQCIHDGFGMHSFGEALSGPEYAARFIQSLEDRHIGVMMGTIVLSLSSERILEVSRREGFERIEARSIVLAMGCRERTRGAISIPGQRPAGIYTAGVAQNLINLQNIMVGTNVCILGSGDIGLIMARRLTLEGVHVEAVFEILPYSSGLPRNIQQCLNDFGIPLFINTTVTEIRGKHRLEGITVAQVGQDGLAIPQTERFIPCDTLLLSVGLIPENELTQEAGVDLDLATGGARVDDTYMTSIPGIFACGNVLYVHDLVDWVSVEAAKAGHHAARFARGRETLAARTIVVTPGEGIRYAIPHLISGDNDFTLSFRVTVPMRDRTVVVRSDRNEIVRKKVIRLHPAEMQQIQIKRELISGCSKVEVVLE